MHTLSDDAKAILLLCGRFRGTSEEDPLDLREYGRVVQWLRDARLRPADLLALEHVPALAGATGVSADRLQALLRRGVKLGFAVEQWNQSGIWVICRSDPEYPARYKSHLKERAPPILFGAGERSLLKGGGLAIVGSRNVDAEGEAFARDTAAWCARQGLPVVSGGARGVDRIAMSGALEAGGLVVGVLADSLLRASVSRESRYALSEGRLLLVSPYHPEAGFSVGNAMGRNKLVYALADYGLVVSASDDRGGTWAGAVEELKRESGRAVFVRMAGAVPKGNRRLIEYGAIPFPSIDAPDADPDRLAALAALRPRAQTESPMPLFARAMSTPAAPAQVREPGASSSATAPSKPAEADSAPPPASVYEAVLPVLLAALEEPAATADLAERLEVSRPQLEAWLTRAVAENKVRRQTRPVRYSRI